jgi:hypothetical protein
MFSVGNSDFSVKGKVMDILLKNFPYQVFCVERTSLAPAIKCCKRHKTGCPDAGSGSIIDKNTGWGVMGKYHQ